MRQLIDFQFGHGTWDIVAERARRIQEAKEAEKQKRIAARRRRGDYRVYGYIGFSYCRRCNSVAILWFIVFRRW